MTDPIAVTGITASLRVPGIYIEVSNAQGPVSGMSADRPTVIVMPKLSSGTYTNNVIVWPRSEAEVTAGCGYRSAAARAWRKARAVDPTRRIGILPYAETSGATPAIASTNVTVTGTATGATVWTLGVADTDNSVSIPNGSTAIQVAALMRTQLANNPVVTVTAGTDNIVTVAYPHAGTRGGTASYKPIKLVTSTPGNGLTITLPGDLGQTVAGTEGSTTEAANLTAALAANSGVWMYNVVIDLGGDSTALAAAAAYILNQALPLNGKRGTVITAYNGAISGGTTLAQALNYERVTFVNGQALRNAPDEIAACIGALFGKYEASDRTYPFAGYSAPDLLLTPVADTSNYPDVEDLNDAILGGQMPISVTPAGKAYIVDATTTRVLDSTGTYADFRAYKRHRVSGADDCADKFASTLALNMQGKKLADDPVDSQGRPVYNNVVPPKVTYPRVLKKHLVKVLRDQDAAGQSQDTEASIASLQCIRSTDNVERILASCNYRTIDHATQGAVILNEVTPG